MNKYIVTTTIQPPTEATLLFSKLQDWKLIIVGDKKTPHTEYDNGNWIYLHPDYQQKTYPETSDLIGWNCIMRRNIGFLEAYKLGADIVASVDDDNIPYKEWGEELLVGQDLPVKIFHNPIGVLDPLQLTNHPELWHRGFPIDRLYEKKTVTYTGIETKEVIFQVGLWDGDPDVDALCRLMFKPTNLNLTINDTFSSDNYIPFNSQNTFIARKALPSYMVLPHVGRSDDIWGGYIAEYILNTRPIFTKATTYQKRNEQHIYKNLDDELLGYRKTSRLLDAMHMWNAIIPEKTLRAFNSYRNEFTRL
jgi:hypothetical protein